MEQLDYYYSTSENRETRLIESVTGTQTFDIFKLMQDGKKRTSQTFNIFKLMQDGKKRTSIEVSNELGMNLNSSRRALSDLKDKFDLVSKLDELKVEQYGKPNHYYQIKK